MSKNKKKQEFFKGFSFWIVLILGAILLTGYLGNQKEVEEIAYSEFRDKLDAGRLQQVEISEEEITGTFLSSTTGEEVQFKTTVVEDTELVKDLREAGVEFKGDISSGWLQMALFNFGPILLLIVIWIVIMNQMRSGGKNALKFGKSKAKMHVKKKEKNITFDNVAGLEEIKEELQEIVEYLRNPKKFTRLGADIPKGVLLYGAPGTGKTLLTKAIAGEADVPFFSASGSEFVEMFVGVGASRIRDLFERGRKNSPCIIFIDELDAVGRSRFSGLGGGHDEREQTLNQILKELDGFDSREGVILIGATNRPDVLDSALLRKGRFDRHIGVPRPNINERKEIFQLHAKDVKMDDDIDYDVLSRRTPGFVGSDIANIINEGALLAGREEADKVTMHHIEEAIDRVIAGPQKKSRVISDEEKEKIAYHEAGHALVALHLENADPVHKVSILSRGPALGYTLQLPLEDKHLTSEVEITDKMTVMLGGRIAEQLIFNEKTTGAQNDLRQVTEMAYKLVTEYGMSDELGPLTYDKDKEKVFLGKDLAQGREYSEETAQLIDKGVKNIIDKCLKKARKILTDNQDSLRKLAEELIEKEIIESDELKRIVGLAPDNNKEEKEEKSDREKSDKNKKSKDKKNSTDKSEKAEKGKNKEKKKEAQVKDNSNEQEKDKESS
ncbi:MAG: ATP-dependent zinc metalloprotease FtsH [Elusimicrobiota bacterium]